jgi:phage shock protein C
MSNRLLRSNDAVLAGVCGGIAEHLGLEPFKVRVVYVVLTVFTAGFPGVVLYFCLWFLLPSASEFAGKRTDPRDI